MAADVRLSKTRQLKHHLMDEMTEHIPVGGRLPSENELIRRFSVSRTTVRQVLTELSSEGLVRRQQGKGTFRIAAELSPRLGGCSMLVGVWFNWPSGPFFGPISNGIREELIEWGYHAVFEGGFETGDEQRGIRKLVKKGLDGFIVSPAHNHDDPHDPLRELLRRKVPVVLVDQPLQGFDCDLVSTYGELGTEVVISHLIELGHRRIAFVGVTGRTTIDDRLRGFQKTMRRAGLPIDPVWVQVTGQVAVDTGREAARLLLALPGAQRPTAIFGANDWIAVTVANIARSCGFSVPQDVSVAGFDDSHVEIKPGEVEWLTTYAQPAYQIGQQAAGLLMRRIQEPRRKPVQVLLTGQLVVRSSTGAPRRDADVDYEREAAFRAQTSRI